ncbi:hypothetical protein CTAYLR_002000 [Chrysophaeum taylorii]|uniref:SET domain-containing protein n=1 Tax=Chrysophaeum taylorii TaxID=2483200 RepID=A0AAD7U8I8_9STRA|nr:hypothetical protein CTAYLR_002000 [Chrysophaeum taylorii]
MLLLNTLLDTARRGVEVVEVCGIKGRGVVARQGFAAGDVVVQSEPLAATGHNKQFLPWTLAPEEAQWGSATLTARRRFEEEAPRVGAAISDGSLRRFPALAAQIAVRLACEPGDTSAFGVVLAALCAPRLEVVPEAWLADHATLREALGDAPDWCTPRWYAGILGRLHLNAMRSTDGTVSALYALPSLFNHDRDPTLLAHFADASVSFYAARSISPEEELTISYLPDDDGGGGSMDQAARNHFLYEHYGFVEVSSFS